MGEAGAADAPQAFLGLFGGFDRFDRLWLHHHLVKSS